MENPNISPYFIEVRIVGRLKYDILSTMGVLTKRFGIDTSKIVPHIRLVGPFDTTDEMRLIEDFKEVCSQAGLMRYKINDITSFQSTDVLYLDIEDDENIELFRLSLNDKLRDYCKLNYWDFALPYKLHITLATDINKDLVYDVCSYMKRCKPFVYEYPLLRATLLKAGKILCEYDFIDDYLYDFREPDEAIISRRSIAQYFHMINEVRQLQPQTYFTADLHFGDIRAFESCKRPFRDLDFMNDALLSNWNATVTPSDTVYFLGDFTYYGCDTEIFEEWASKVNGNIVFVRGNHDERIVSDKISFVDYAELNISGYRLSMVHNPTHIPKDIRYDPNTWVIHGHAHNKALCRYPYFNRATRHINVSTDVTHYRPVSLGEIKNLINQETLPRNEAIMSCEQTDCGIEAN